ncbi:MBL fold metallo-hydrolase [Streptacidiphilus monticola]
MVQPLDDETPAPTAAPAPEQDAAQATAQTAEQAAWRERRLPPVQDLGGGVWSVPVPIPGSPLRYTLVYLLESDAGPVLVDTGWDDPAGRAALAEGVAAAGFDLAGLHGVLITHHHPDHHGLSAHVREQSGAWIAMHAAETTLVRTLREVPSARWLGRMARLLADQGTRRSTWSNCARWAATVRRASPTPGRRAPRPQPGGRRGRGRARPVAAGRAHPGPHPGHVCLYLDEQLNGRRHPGCSPATTSSPRSARRSASTPSIRTRSRPTPSATTWTRWSASAASTWPRCCPRTSTGSRTPPPAPANWCSTTRHAWPSCTANSSRSH